MDRVPDSTDELQGVLFDLGEGQRLKEEAIDRVERNAAEEWKRVAYEAVRMVCNQRQEFTTDDVWRLLRDKPDEPRAMGAIMRQAARSGLCYKTDRVIESAIPTCHRRPVAVWRSLR